MNKINERDADAAWLKAEIAEAGTAPFVLAPKVCRHTQEEILKIVGPRLPHGSAGVALLITTIEAIDDVGVVLKPEHRRDFAEGHFVYMVPQKVECLEERPQGRQEVSPREAVVRDGLYANVALGARQAAR
ncbi:hypothetical protein [Pelagibacterium mangrovi]|uniref:hypothetical protein n=1 Tax=Pelagibacterium mangrovi TaxID=3119828 RepID=UPI002FC874BE